MTPELPALRDEGTSPAAFVACCHDTAVALRDVLQLERAALGGAPPPDINSLLDQKARLADELDRLETARRQRWPGNSDALTSALDPAGRAAWQGYLDVLGEVREANAINGRLLQARQRNVREALAILRGADAASGGTYDQSGTRPDGLDPVVLGSA